MSQVDNRQGSAYIILDLLAPSGPCGAQLLQALQGMDVSQLQYCNAEVGGARAVLKAGAAELDGPHPTITELPQHVFAAAAAAATGTLQLEVVGEHLGEPGVQALLRGRGSEHVRLPAQHVAADGRTATFHVPFMPPTEQPGDQQSEHTAGQAPQQVVAKPSPHLPARPGLYWLCVTRGVWLGPSWPVLLVDPADEEVISLLPALDQHSSTATSSSSSSSSDKRALVVKLAAVLARARPDCYFAFQAAVPLKVLLHWARDVLRLAIRAGNMRARSLVRQVLAQPDVKALLGTLRPAAGAREPQDASKPSLHTEAWVEASTWPTTTAGGGGAAGGVGPGLALPEAHKVLGAASGPSHAKDERGMQVAAQPLSGLIPASATARELPAHSSASGAGVGTGPLGVSITTSADLQAPAQKQLLEQGLGVTRPAKNRAAEAAETLLSGVTTYSKEVAVLTQKLQALLGRRLSDHPDIVKLYQYFFQVLLQFAELTQSVYEATLELHTCNEQFLKLSSRDLDARRLAALHEQAKGQAIKLRRLANDQMRVQLLVTQLVGHASKTKDDLHKVAENKQKTKMELKSVVHRSQQIGVAFASVAAAAAAAGAAGALVLAPLAAVASVGATVAAMYSWYQHRQVRVQECKAAEEWAAANTAADAEERAAYQQSQATKQKREAAEKQHAAEAAADAEERALEAIKTLRDLVPCIGTFRDVIDPAVTGLNLVAAESERFMVSSRPKHAHDLGDVEHVHEELSRIAEGVQGQCKGLEDELPKLQAACRALYDAAALILPQIPKRNSIHYTTADPVVQNQHMQQYYSKPADCVTSRSM